MSTNTISRDEFKKLIQSGRLYARAGLYEQIDFFVDFENKLYMPYIDITDKPTHHFRAINFKV